MRQFFYTVFGGLIAIACGIGIAYLGAAAWHFVRPRIDTIKIPVVGTAAVPVQTTGSDSTTISGMKRTIRFTADEEEDLINAAAQALPSAADKKITATAYIVKNLTRGDTAIEHNADQLQPIASLSKLVTAAVVRRLIAPETRITLTQSIMATYGNTAEFKIGETLTAGDMMYPLLMVSSNDAAEAYAQSYGRKKFIQAMNDFTQSIGAYRTYFADPSGLSEKNVSTANDLAIILKWIHDNDPEIINITALKSKTIRSHTFINPTHFLSWSYYVGGKNGYTPEADRTAASLFALGKNKNLYAVIVLGSESRDGDELKLLAKVE